MKNHIIAIVIAICALLLGCTELSAAPKKLKGSGRLVRKELRITDSIDAVTASNGIHVELVEGSSKQIRLEADDNVIDHVTVQVKNKTLQIAISREYNTVSNIHVTVTVPTDGYLKRLRASSAAKIVATPTIRSSSVELDCSSAAKIQASVEAKQCDIDCSSAAKVTADVKGTACSLDISSSGAATVTLAVERCEVEVSSTAKATLKGAALQCEAEVSSAAKLQAGDLAVKRYRIDCSSAGSASICCLEELNASASSAGSIHYTGDCVCRQIKTSSAGRISR